MPSRTEILQALRAKVARHEPIIGGGAGTGLSAKCSQEAGLDFIVIYNSGRYRMAGRSSMAGLMPYGDANAIVMEMGQEVLPVATTIPVVAGVCATDPFRLMPQFLRQVKDAGFSGVQNYPTVCLFDGIIRANLEETGLGFDKEVDMIRRGPRDGSVHRQLCGQPGRGSSDGRRRQRHRGAAHGADHLGHDRRPDRTDAWTRPRSRSPS